MRSRETVDKLLLSLNLCSKTIPSEEAWDKFLTETEAQISHLDEQLKKNQALQQLSYEEMRAWASLVEVRESTIKGILDSSTNMIITVNQIGYISEFNHVSEEKTGLRKDQINGRSIFETLMPSPFLESLKGILGDTQDTKVKDVYKFETQLYNKCGQLFTAEANISKIKIGLDYIYAIYIHDLTNELKAQSDIDQIREQAIYGSKMASLGEMAAGVAHEINNPLAIIILACKIMKNIIKTPVVDMVMLDETIDTVSSTTDRISRIVKGLKSFSRQGELKDVEEVVINDVVSDALNLCNERFKNHGITLSFEGNKSTVLVCQPIAIAQVLLNLLNNSFDAIEGQEEKFVKIECKEKGSEVFLSVTDSGKGIRKEILDKLMQPFFTTKEIGKGTGLGLSISRGLIESHGGTLTYDEESPNTRFVIKLPKKKITKKSKT